LGKSGIAGVGDRKKRFSVFSCQMDFLVVRIFSKADYFRNRFLFPG